MNAVSLPTVRRGLLVAFVVSVFAAIPLTAQKAPLFPEPLHVSRTVEDPLMNGPVTIEEYYFGNRVVSVLGQKVVIADYDRGDMTEIDRQAGTYSVTTFEQLAALNAIGAQKQATATEEQLELQVAQRRSDSRASESYEAKPKKPHGNLKKLEIGVDRNVKLSRDAVEVMVGAAYPRVRSLETDFFLRGASPSPTGPVARTQSAGGRGVADHSLPVDQIVSFDFDGQEIVVRNRIVRVQREAPPADAIAIPPGARLVESNAVTAARTIQDIEPTPTKSKQ